jgi:aryl-alcohol dehydrogenase-like predicted oxidoreductase
MQTRRLGAKGPEGSALGLGCMGLSPKARRLGENIGGGEIDSTEADLRTIGNALAETRVQGSRHPAHMARHAGR